MSLPLTLALTLFVPGQDAGPPGPLGIGDAPDLKALSECVDTLDLSIFNSPRRPHRGAPLRVLVTSESLPLEGATLFAKTPEGTTVTLDRVTPTGGPPFGLVAEVDRPMVGDWRVALVRNGAVLACQDLEVRERPSGPGALEVGVDPFWETRIKWERDTENLFSLWVERLFDAPLSEDVSWNPLSKVIGDPKRNLLYDHLGLGEDKDGLKLDPDCADFPYTLRAYFAWKMGLPFAMRKCRRGNAERAPTCGEELTTNEEPTDTRERVAAFRSFFRKLKATVHSSSLRGAPKDERSDFYPVALNRKALRPGTIYADPYGHTMMVLRWYPQSADKAGVLMTVDAQPDGTVGRRLFWKGAFLFPKDGDVAGAGWKRFRPVRKKGASLIELDNAAIAQSIDYGDFSTEQWERGQDGFYEAMDAVISPSPMRPETALLATIDALHQQALRRVESIEAVRPWHEKNRGKVIPMPKGSDIFLTAGPWEDFSTPSRDMRMLIAIDTVLDFPARVKRRPERFVLAPGETADALSGKLRERLVAEARSRTLSYVRSDGVSQTLTLEDLMNRKDAIELAWNPNDCPELRWGAPEGSSELASCRRRAPAEQQERMATMRQWFIDRQRPLQH